MAPNAFGDLHKFLRSRDLGQYAEPFFSRGVRLENFHCITKERLAQMRVTHSKTVKELLNLAQRRTNLKDLGNSSTLSRRDVLTPNTEVKDRAEELTGSLRTAQSAQPTAAGLTADSSLLQADSPNPPQVWTPAQATDGGPTDGGPASAADVRTPGRSTALSPRNAAYTSETLVHPTASHCIRQVASNVRPTSKRQRSLAQRLQRLQCGVAGAEHEHSTEHDHGKQGRHCGVCSAMNLTSDSVEDRLKALRRKQTPFPESEAKDPLYPQPQNFALEFRITQIDVDWHAIQLQVWTEEEEVRAKLQAAISAELERLRNRAFYELIAAEIEMRRDIMTDEAQLRAAILAEAASDLTQISLRMRRRSYEEALLAQRQCLARVESYERQCVLGEEEAEFVVLADIEAHLAHMHRQDQKARNKQLMSLDLRRENPFHKRPWRPWRSQGRQVLREDAETAPPAPKPVVVDDALTTQTRESRAAEMDARYRRHQKAALKMRVAHLRGGSDQAKSGLARTGSFFKNYMTNTAEQIEALTGRCHGISLLSEIEDVLARAPRPLRKQPTRAVSPPSTNPEVELSQGRPRSRRAKRLGPWRDGDESGESPMLAANAQTADES